MRRQSLQKVDNVAARRNMTPMAESDNKKKKPYDVQARLHVILMQCPDSRMGGGGVEDEE